MADLTDAKGLPPDGQGQAAGVWPEGMTETTWDTLEPLLTAQQLRSRFLKGIPLVSGFPDPVTRKREVWTDDDLKDYVRRAVPISEADARIDIFPRVYSEKPALDRVDYESFGYLKLKHRPVAELIKVTVRPSDNQDVFTVPMTWIETANLAQGQVNFIPLGVSLVNNTSTGIVSGQPTGAGAYFLNILGNRAWIPAFWGVDYVSGFKDGQIPILVNELVGCNAAILVLRDIAKTYAHFTSASLGADGLSQSLATPGPQRFDVIIAKLEEERMFLKKKLQALYGQRLYTSQV